MPTREKPITLYVDADACPVKDEAYRVAVRHGIAVVVVANAPIAIPKDPLIRRQLVPSGPDEADHFIAAEVSLGDVVVTADIPLADRCLKAGAEVVAPNGKPFTSQSIGMALATRNLMEDLRSAGATTSGPRPFAPADRSRFLSALDAAIVRLKRAGFEVTEPPKPG